MGVRDNIPRAPLRCVNLVQNFGIAWYGGNHESHSPTEPRRLLLGRCVAVVFVVVGLSNSRWLTHDEAFHAAACNDRVIPVRLMIIV